MLSGDRLRTLATRERSLTSGSRKSRTTTSKARRRFRSAALSRRHRSLGHCHAARHQAFADRPANERLVVDDEDVRNDSRHIGPDPGWRKAGTQCCLMAPAHGSSTSRNEPPARSPPLCVARNVLNPWRLLSGSRKEVFMIVLKNVLVATDFGDASRVALDYGRDLARSIRRHPSHPARGRGCDPQLWR